MKGKIMSQDKSYKPGHFVHFIQARLALQDTSSWRPAVITEIGDGTLKVKTNDGVTHEFKCVETDRLREVYERGRVPDGGDGKGLALIASRGVLIVPCANQGHTFPRLATINASVAAIEQGAATSSPTENGAWHLFSISAE